MSSTRFLSNNQKTSNSRKGSSGSVIDQLDQLYRVRKYRHNGRKFNIIEINDDESECDDEEIIDGYCACCKKLQRKPCWKPFKEISFFILHFLIVLVILFCGAMVLARIEDPAPEPVEGNEGTKNMLINYTNIIHNMSDSLWSSLQINYGVTVWGEENRQQFLDEVSDFLNKKQRELNAKKHREELEDRFFIITKWLYFVTVACTTIGYGDITPQTNDGRFFYIFFSIIGIPLMVTLLKSCGALITKVNKKFFSFLNRCCFPDGEPKVSKELLSAISVFILFLSYVAAGCLFNAAVSGWPLFTSIYFWIVTFTTVGFGDVTHTLEDQSIYLFPLLVYRVFGLAMLAAVIDSILNYLNVRKVVINKKVLEKKLQISKRYADKRKNSEQIRRRRRRISRNKGIMTFDARIHEPIFGTGDHYGDDCGESDFESAESASEGSYESS